MAGSRLLVPTSHGEGRAEFATPSDLAACERDAQLATAMSTIAVRRRRFIRPIPTVHRAVSPACVRKMDGSRSTPHPERVQRTVQHSWHPADWGDDGPWLRLFRNARVFAGS